MIGNGKAKAWGHRIEWFKAWGDGDFFIVNVDGNLAGYFVEEAEEQARITCLLAGPGTDVKWDTEPREPVKDGLTAAMEIAQRWVTLRPEKEKRRTR